MEKINVAKRVVAMSKKEWNGKWARVLSESFESNKKLFWKEVRKVRGVKVGVRGERVKDERGRVLMEGSRVRGRWREYFKELLNWQDESKACISAIGGMPVCARERGKVGKIERCEVSRAVGKLKGGKAPGGMAYMWRW